MLYPVAINIKDNKYLAHLPDIPELSIESDNMADIISSARAVVMSHLLALVEEEQPIPEASQINTHLMKPEYAGRTWAILNLDVKRLVGEQIEVSIRMQQKLFSRIQKQLGITDDDINEFVIEAIKSKLN